MAKHIRVVLLISLTALALQHVIAQPVPTPEFPFKMTVEEYVEKYSAIAVEEMQRSRIPASITLAQGLIESGNGNSRLAIIANNHFGIKCRKDWTGESITHDDDAPQECFRKYPTPLDSYRDHSEFLRKGQRYSFLFDLEITDYKAWAYGLKKAGYATNPKYAEILIGIIERNNLQRFDVMKPSEVVVKKIEEEKKEEIKQEKNITVNGVPAIIVAAGESFASLAIANDMRVWQLYKYNDLNKDAAIKPGDTIYLKPKNYKATIENCVVGPKDNMHILSQRFAIKLSRLLALNKMKEGQEPEIGEIINLRSKRSSPPVLKNIPPPLVDSVYDNVVYADPLKNIETSRPVIPDDPYDVSVHGVKEPMAFFHIVQPGETLFSIAKRYNLQVDGIKDLNRLKNDVIKPGDKLIINPNQPLQNKSEEAIIPGYHTVIQGETLYSIAKLYGTTVELLKTLNDLQNDTIRIGDELIVLPRHGEKPGEQKVTDDNEGPVYYEVRQGETLFSISRKFSVDISTLRKLNDLMDNTILAGQMLRIR
jgi:LysM repeat protein